MSKAAANPKVSVVITTYNRAALLPRAIRSVLAQTYEDYELIIVDDCSTDDTPEVVQRFADSRIHAVRQAENRGQSAAVNTGIRLARGEYIAFLDDDDEWVDTKLLHQVRTLDASDPRVGLVYTWFDYVDAASGVRRAGGRSVMSGDLWEDMLQLGVPAPTSTYLVRAEAARQIGGFDETLTNLTDRDFLVSPVHAVARCRRSRRSHADARRAARCDRHNGRVRSKVSSSISSPTCANSTESWANAPRRSLGC